MRESDALLAAIVAHPDEDTPRLMYADWLDENQPDKTPTPATGPSARAEFIRVQCRLAAITAADSEYIDLRDRQEDLASWLESNAPEKPKLPGKMESDDTSYSEYHRGFLYRAADEPASDRRKAVARLRSNVETVTRTTTVRWLRLFWFPAQQTGEFVQQPEVALLRGLNVQPGIHDYLDENDGDPIGAYEHVVHDIVHSPHVRNLRSLYLHFVLSDDGAEALARAKNLGNLREIALNLSEVSPKGLRALARTDWFRNLHTLRFDCELDDAKAAALAALPSFPNLRVLDLTDNAFTATGAARLAASKAFPNLVELHIDRTVIGPKGAAALAKAKWRLAVLNMRACGLGSTGLAALAGSRLLESVKVADFAANEIGPKGGRALAESPHAAALRHLDIGYNPLGKGGFLALAGSPHLRNLTQLNLATHVWEKPQCSATEMTEFLSQLEMPNLRSLVLDEQTVGTNGAKALATSPFFGQLRYLNLNDGKIGDSGLKALAASPHLQRLVQLHLFQNRLGVGAAVLTDRTVWPQLSECTLHGNKIPLAIARKIKRARRGMWIDTD